MQSGQQNKYYNYANDIVKGNIPACEHVINACKRFFADLDVYEFRESKVIEVFDFIAALKHTKGKWKGSNFILEPWQAFGVANIFGFYTEEGTRRFTKSYWEMPKKNGKSPLAAAIASYCLTLDGEPSPEVYSIATELPQAAISWGYSADMLEDLNNRVPELGISVKRGENNRRVLIDDGRNGIFSPLSFGDNERHDGKSPSFGLVDEYHAHKNDRGYAILADGTGARENPHIMVITTAGFDKQSACYSMREHCIKVLNNQIKDESQFAIIYTTDKDDDWTKESTWVKANPNYGVSVSKRSFEDEVIKAKELPSAEVTFRTKKLNEWMDSYTTWIPDSLFSSRNTWFKPNDGETCWGGLDLARTGDFSALSFDFYLDNKHRLVTKYYMPEEVMLYWPGEIGANLRAWAKEGWITVTPGKSTDYAYIEKDIVNFTKTYNVESIGYDVANSKDLATRLENYENINMVPFGQGITVISLPTKRLAEVITKGNFEYDGNPVTRWMMGNVQIYSDANDNIKIVKSIKGQYNKSKKVDGPVSMVMALGEAINHEYEQEWQPSEKL